MLHFSLLIIDDHDIVAQGIAAQLSSLHLGCCHTAATAEEALHALGAGTYDVAILDLQLATGNGAALASQIKQASPNTRIIVYTMHDELWALHDIQTLCPHGVVFKSEPPALLQDAVRAVAQGNVPFHSPRYEELMQESGRVELGSISLRVLSLISQGLSSKEIADRICLTESTIEYHRKRLMRHFHARNIAHLIALAMQQGYLRR